MARIHFIVDPVNEQIGKRWPYEQKKIESLTKDFEMDLVRGRSHAEALATQAKGAGAELIVCVGGDSALNEIANAVHSDKSGKTSISIHPELHSGDLSKSLDLKSNIIEFLELFLNGKAQEQFIDVGEVEYTGEYGQTLKRIFVNYFSFGFASYLLTRVAKHKYDGPSNTRFLRLLLGSLPFYRIPTFKISVDSDEEQSLALLTGFVNNIRYVARGLKISPQSTPMDGSFEFTRVKRSNMIKYMLGALPFYAGQTNGLSFIDTIPCKQLKIEPVSSGRAIRLDFDGECRGFLPAKIKMKEKALRVLV